MADDDSDDGGGKMPAIATVKKEDGRAAAAAATATTTAAASQRPQKKAPAVKQEQQEEEEPPSPQNKGILVIDNSGSVKEEHGNPIYCIAWSDDLFTEEKDANDDEHDESTTAAAAAIKRQGSSSSSSPHYHYYRCFASCAGRNVTIYEVKVPKPNWLRKKHHHHHHNNNNHSHKRQSSGTIRVKQAYFDPHPGEEFYACEFGGRSVGGLSDFVPTAATATDTGCVFSGKRGTKANTNISVSLSSLSRKRKFNHNDDNTDDEEEGDDEEEEYAKKLLDPQYEPTGPQLLFVGGKCFSIKVIDTVRQKLVMTLSGHGDHISTLKICPTNQWILLSASYDRACRIWNVRNASCIAIFAGHEAHRDAVLCAAWHPSGDKIVSGGHDNLVKIWDIGENTKIGQAIQESFAIPLQRKPGTDAFEAKDYFKALYWQFPIFSTDKVHFQPVDCVEFLGDLVMSKATNKIVLWDPDYTRKGNPKVTHPPPCDLFALKTFTIVDIEEYMMFYRFGTDSAGRTMAVGTLVNNRKGGGDSQVVGAVEVWSEDLARSVLLFRREKTPSMVRMVAFSPDDNILICCCDDASIWKWDLSSAG